MYLSRGSSIGVREHEQYQTLGEAASVAANLWALLGYDVRLIGVVDTAAGGCCMRTLLHQQEIAIAIEDTTRGSSTANRGHDESHLN